MAGLVLFLLSAGGATSASELLSVDFSAFSGTAFCDLALTVFLGLEVLAGEATLGIFASSFCLVFLGDILGFGVFTVFTTASLAAFFGAPRLGLLVETSSASLVGLLFFSTALLLDFFGVSFAGLAVLAGFAVLTGFTASTALAALALAFNAALGTWAFFGLAALAFFTPRVLVSVDDGALASTA